MATSDVEMEDAHKSDPGNDIKDSKDEVLCSEIEVKEEKLLSEVTVVRNDDSKNGGDNLSKFSNEEKDQVTSMSELENKTHHENVTNEPMAGDLVEPTGKLVNAVNKNGKEISTEANTEVQTDADTNEPMAGVPVEPTGELVNAENKNEKEISTEANAEVQSDAESKVQKLNDAMTEMVENSEANDGLKEEHPVENGVESKNPVENVEVHSCGDIALEKTKDSEEDKIFATNVEKNTENGGDSWENKKLETGLSSNEGPQVQILTLDEVIQSGDKGKEAAATANEDKIVNDGSKKQAMEIVFATPVTDGNATTETLTKLKVNDYSLSNQHEAATSISPVRCFPAHMGNHGEQAEKTFYSHATLPLVGESDDGTPEEQAAFMRQLESFYREKAMDFKPPKFYGQPLNCLKLWRAVIKLGGYDRVTGSKLWRQVGESFHPPKTCTTVSWTFRIFYEKSLLEFERHKRISGDLQLPMAMLALPEPSGGTADSEGNSYQGSGSGRARRDAAARAMQGWLVQRHSDYGETGEPVTKDKNINNMVKREKNIKSIASLKQKRPNEVEHPVKAARTETSKQLVTPIVDIGPPADWVKINVLQMKECFEIYVLIPGLLRDEVRVQSDPDGRLVITGQPAQADNPWGITPFKKVVRLPARIDPLHASAVVSFHGRLLVRVPFESNS